MYDYTYPFVTLISYPINTSVLVPFQPLVPAALSMKRLVGSIYKLEMTPARGGPGIMRNGTVECLKARLSRRSYKRIISCDALRRLVSSDVLYYRDLKVMTYHTRCRPLTMGFTALTAPLPPGNLRTLSGSQPRLALWMSNSSTVPFRRPA